MLKLSFAAAAVLCVSACSSETPTPDSTGGTGGSTGGGAGTSHGGQGPSAGRGGAPGVGGASTGGVGGAGGSAGTAAGAQGGGAGSTGATGATGGASGSGTVGGAGGAGGAGATAGTGTGGVSGGAATGGASGSAGSGAGGAGGAAGSGAGGAGATHWVGTWATGPQITEEANLPPSPGLANNTLRQMVHVSIPGTQLRVRLSNAYGTAAVTMNSVHIAKATSTSAIDTASDKALTFGGMPNVTIASKMSAVSDPIDFDLAAMSNVAISIAFGAQSGDVTGHPGSRTNVFITAGNHVSDASISGASTAHWYFIEAIDVMAPETSAAVAILGDSITDGRGSTTDMNNRWPDLLAKRLQANAATQGVGVLNLGIGGGAVVTGGLGPTALARFDSQILGQSGVKWVMVMEGVNDINAGTAVNSITSAYQTFIDKSHTNTLKIYGMPILPFGGSDYDKNGAEDKRDQINAFIRMPGKFDAVVDGETAVGDGAATPKLKAGYDDNDKLHLSPTGAQALADSIDLALFAP